VKTASKPGRASISAYRALGRYLEVLEVLFDHEVVAVVRKSAERR